MFWIVHFPEQGCEEPKGLRNKKTKRRKTFKVYKPAISRRRATTYARPGKKTWKWSRRNYALSYKRIGAARVKTYIPVERRFESYRSEILRTTESERNELGMFFDDIVTRELNQVRG